MKQNEYLNEERYQQTNKKVDLIGKILLVCGGLSFVVCTILLFGNFLEFETSGLVGVLWVFSFSIAGFGLMLFMTAHSRQITAYMAQQQMPVAKEGIEKMAPTAGVVAREISKGIKEGLKDDNQE